MYLNYGSLGRKQRLFHVGTLSQLALITWLTRLIEHWFGIENFTIIEQVLVKSSCSLYIS
uniref:Uncharacterized protein n=1 Tax=Tetranychus urticae TaxID=32264 RepID=T1KI62_TETUR